MKFSRMASLVCLLCLFPLSVPVQAADSLKISSTIGPVDAGILPLLADIDPEAQAVGAVNCVRVRADG